MADPWAHLFDNEYRQRADIEAASERISGTQSEIDTLRARVKRAELRSDRLELVIEGLLTYMAATGGIDREGLAVWTARLDLADGVEDGRVGPDRASQAPSCGGCGRPINPERSQCLYCGIDIQPDTVKPPERMVSCRVCSESVPEREVYFTGRGMVCSHCYVP